MSFELKGHEHRVSPVTHRDGLECDACDRSYGDAYSCDECKFTIHQKCAFVFELREIIDHPCHDGHSLEFLTTGAPDHSDPKCHICGKTTKRLLYHCYTCNLNLDINCIIDALCSRADLNFPWHHHPLLMIDFWVIENMECDVCGISFGNSYCCLRCRLRFHKKCVPLMESLEITHPCHAKHSLKLFTKGAPGYTDPKCHLCGEDTGKFIYHCDICKFNLDLKCATQNPPQVALSNLKVHEHTLTLMPRLISFVCDACGTKGDRAPYVCHPCDFMIHQKCAHLPRVIHVNHHDHRVSYIDYLGPGEWRCGVCWEEIDWSYGAYSCAVCPRYAIHSLCATRDDVWDGEELDGIPEEVEDIEPFKRIDDSTITHCAHEHNLSLNKDGEESSLCEACVRPIGSYTFYSCSNSDCSFILHETCVNFPKKKRHFLSTSPLKLLKLKSFDFHSTCTACSQVICEGFVYCHDYYGTFDLLCSSIPVPFIHGSHPHPLLYLKLEYGDVKTCQSCGIDSTRAVLGCAKCNYFLDFRCATLPLKVILPRYDDHPLTLCYSEQAIGKYWCDICERETNPQTWFYTCKDCGVTLHIFCVHGDIRYAKPGGTIGCILELLPNNRSTRPFCDICYCRCPGPFIIYYSRGVMFFCSYFCYECSLRRSYPMNVAMCPPWAFKKLEPIFDEVV